MVVQNIVLAGTPSLRNIAQTVPPTWFNTPPAHTLIEVLIATMKARQGVGLAAPQIGVGLQIFTCGFDYNARYPDQDPVALQVFINPQIIQANTELVYLYEGCLSLPQVRGLVPRHQSLTLRAQNVHGEWFEKQAYGFEARIIQHELDHLKGTLFPERMDNLRTLGTTVALREAHLIR